MHADRFTRAALAWALLLSVLGLLFVQGEEAWRGSRRRLGFVADEEAQGVLVESVMPGQPADRAGLRPGDRILAAAGRSVADLSEYERVGTGFRRGRPVPLRIERGGEILDLKVVPGGTPRWGLLAMSCLTALGFLGVALLALTRGIGDMRVRLLFGFAAAGALEIALPINVVGRVLPAAVSAYYLLTGLQIGLELHLASLTPERPRWLRARPWIVPLYYGAGLGLGLASCATYLSQEVIGRRIFPWTMDEIGRLLDEVGLPVWALAVTLLLASQALRHPEPRGRQQAGLVLAAAIPWLLFIVSSTVLERSGVPLPDWVWPLETLILLGHPVAFFAAIFRYHLFDLELVVRRGLLYTTLTGALMLVFYAALGAGGAIFSRLVAGSETVWSAASATLLLGLVFSPLRSSLHRVIDRRFFPEREALRRRLIDLAAELPALGKLPRMGGHLVERTASIFTARWVALLIAHPETGLMSVLAATPGAPDILGGSEPDGLSVPLLSRERPIGALVLGRKEGSRSYPAEEIDLLNLLAHHAAI
ncbi:MAG TPA: PDZ domain-containing protein, partial [Thermoanaerobaculia bacterium]|nr:PDZ domain-containing protein [Thermoanaerobaculia bacterium]